SWLCCVSLVSTSSPSPYPYTLSLHDALPIASKLNNSIDKNCFTAPPVIGSEEPPGTCAPSQVLPDGNCPPVAAGFGNSGVGILRGPSEINFDFSLFKHFPLHKLRDSGDLEFRSEFFNIFNHPLSQDPDTNL